MACVQTCALRFALFFESLLSYKNVHKKNKSKYSAREYECERDCTSASVCVCVVLLTCLSLTESAAAKLEERAFLAAAWSRRRCLRVVAVLVLMAAGAGGGPSSAILERTEATTFERYTQLVAFFLSAAS